jgi:D-alanyl-D-alanine carboxypeptidase (penicillin-binding protein 5/6)
MTEQMSSSPRRKLRPTPWLIGTGFIAVLFVVYVVIMFFAPMPTVKATTTLLSVSVPARAVITWPTDGQAAVGVKGQGVLLTNGEQKSVPIASVAKLVLALELLQKQPMQLNQPGGTITITDADEQLYRDKIKENQSVVPVKVGEQLTQYQALQALLLPSGNNIADTLANWAFGSVSNYLAIANKQLADWGLTQTHLDDASGFSPQTVSSAHDLVLIGEKVLAEPVLAEIVKQSEVTLPVAGLEHNVNTLLGTSNIIGIKTGNTDEAGGCFLFAAGNGDGPAIIGAFLGMPKLADALAATTSFLKASAGNFTPIVIAPAGSTVATYDVPWGKPINAITKSAATIIGPTNTPVTTSVTVPDLTSPTLTSVSIGTLYATVDTLKSETPLVLSSPLQRPLFRWR